MTKVEAEILTTLRELEAGARSMLTANPKPDLRPLFAHLDELAAQLPADGDSELRHFLQRKSYEKARQWLEGRSHDIARGQCGR
ncbi:MAG: hypothetical protein IPM17_18050 [Verrucomicrobia bacterium]|jgi:hypothetical protein|nr:hypothetical protein [Verrucomicrobiota bacterium]